MHNYLDAVAHRFVNRGTIANVTFDESKVVILEAIRNVPPFDLWVVEVVEIVKPHYLPALAQKALAQV